MKCVVGSIALRTIYTTKNQNIFTTNERDDVARYPIWHVSVHERLLRCIWEQKPTTSDKDIYKNNNWSKKLKLFNLRILFNNNKLLSKYYIVCSLEGVANKFSQCPIVH